MVGFISFAQNGCTHIVYADSRGSHVLLEGSRYAEADWTEGGALERLDSRVEAGVAEVDVVDLQHTGNFRLSPFLEFNFLASSLNTTNQSIKTSFTHEMQVLALESREMLEAA